MSADPITEPDEATEHEEGYSIRRKAGADIGEQLDLANWHLEQAQQSRRAADLQAESLERRAADLQHRAASVRESADHKAEWHEWAVKTWAQEPTTRDALGKSVTLTVGRVTVRKSRGKTEIVKEAVLALAQRDDTLWGTVVVQDPRVVLSAARKRFVWRDGAVIDTTTGEVCESVIYEAEDGNQALGAIMVQTEIPQERAVIEYTGGSTDGDSSIGSDDSRG